MLLRAKRAFKRAVEASQPRTRRQLVFSRRQPYDTGNPAGTGCQDIFEFVPFDTETRSTMAKGAGKARKKLPKELAVVRADNCTGCEACIEVCPVDCIYKLPGV